MEEEGKSMAEASSSEFNTFIPKEDIAIQTKPGTEDIEGTEIPDETINAEGKEIGQSIVDSTDSPETNTVSREDQTSEDKMADYKAEFKDEETLAKYEADPIAFIEDDIRSWESQPDSEEKTQSIKNLTENLDILKNGSFVNAVPPKVKEATGEKDETTKPKYSNSTVTEDGDIIFDFNGKKVKESDFADPPMKNKDDGQDYIRNIHNEEAAFGSFSGSGVGNYGYTGTGPKGGALLEYYNQAEGSSEEKAMTTTNKYIIGEDGQGELNGFNTTILQDLDMSRENFDKLTDDVKSELVNWKLNTGRGSTDLILIASGGDWDGSRAYDFDSPSSDKIKNIDLSKLTKSDLNKARQELYKGRIEGLRKEANKPDDGSAEYEEDIKEYKRKLKEAERGYNNSQKYR